MQRADAGEGLLPAGSRAGATPKRGCCCCVLQCVWNSLLLLIFIILLPLLLLIFGLACFLPALERMFRPRRKYLDSVSSWQIRHLEEAVIQAVLISKTRVSADKVFECFDKTYLSSDVPEFSRWKERIVRRDWFWPYWVDASSDFTASAHFIRHSEPVSKEELERRVAEFQAQPMNFDKPTWQLHHFENFCDENGIECSASLLRLHHAMCDGFTGLRALMHGAEPNAPPNAASGNQTRADRRRKIGCCQAMRLFLTSLKKLLLMPTDPVSPFKGTNHVGHEDPRSVAWTTLRTSSVEDIKKVGKDLGGATVNDILIAALAGAFRTYAQESPTSTPANITTCIWVSLSPLKHVYTSLSEMPLRWGNSTLGACYVPLPVGSASLEMSPMEAVQAIQETTSSPALMVEAKLMVMLLGLVGMIPKPLISPIWHLVGENISVSMSNVPGPQFPLEWCGMPLGRMLFFMPATGTLSFVTIGTFNGEVSVGMGTDINLFSQETLSRITGELFEAEIEKLRRAAATAA